MRPCMLNEWVKKNVPTNPEFLWASAKKFFAMADVHFTLGLRLDVDIGGFDIELSSMPKQTSIGNELQYQICCLDASEIASWN